MERDESVRMENSRTAALARESFGAWIGTLREWSYFATFTYDPKKFGERHAVYVGSGNDRTLMPYTVGLQKLRRDMQRFVLDAGRRVGGIDLVAGFEPHESGSLHAHGLIRPLKGAKLGDIREFHSVWEPSHGYIKVEELTAGAALAAEYVVKFDRIARYTTKHQGDVFFSRSLNVEN